MRSYSESYRQAGVDIEAGYEGVKRMRKHVERTFTPSVLSGIGGFGGLFAPDVAGMRKPVLVSGTDGVGTKLRIAQLMDKHDTVGIDCVAMCVNDIICCGAKPLFFLDYLAMRPQRPRPGGTSMVSGVAEGCCPGGLRPHRRRDRRAPRRSWPRRTIRSRRLLRGHRGAGTPSWTTAAMRAGDVILALPSSGVHSNGYSLVRKVFDVEHADLGQYVPELGTTLGEALLTPTGDLREAGPGGHRRRRRFTVSAISPAAASMRTSPVRSQRASVPGSKRGMSAPPLSSRCCGGRGRSRSGICSTPTTWASA